MAERLHIHFSLSCKGNGNPFQCSCLENPRDGGARWAAVYEVSQSQTLLKRLSSSRWCSGERIRLLMQETQKTWVQSLDLKDPLEKRWKPTSVFLPGKFHGQRSLMDYSQWGCKEWDMTKHSVLLSELKKP